MAGFDPKAYAAAGGEPARFNPVAYAAEEAPDNLGVSPQPSQEEHVAALAGPEAQAFREAGNAYGPRAQATREQLGIAPAVRPGEAPPIQEDPAALRRVLMAVQPDEVAQEAAGNAASAIAPDQAASALQLSASSGLAPSFVSEYFDTVRRSLDEKALLAELRFAPNVAAYMAQDPHRAALVRDDVEPLTAIEWWLTGRWRMAEGEAYYDPATGVPMVGGPELAEAPVWLAGLRVGASDLTAALLANKQAKRGLAPMEEAELVAAERESAAGVAGATTLPRKVAAEISRALGTVGALGGAGLAGAGVGFATGGPAGATILGGGAMFFAAYTLNYGPLYRRLRARLDGAGQPELTDDQAKAWASGGSIVAAGLQTTLGGAFLRSLPGVAPLMQRLAGDAASQAVKSGVTRAAMDRLLQAGGHALSGGLLLAGQSAVNQATEEFAKPGEPDWGNIGHAAAEGFKSGLLLAPLAAIEPGRAFLRDVGRIHDARLDTARLDMMAAQVRDSKLAQRSPAEAERLLATMAGDDARTVYVDQQAIGREPGTFARVVDAAGPQAVAEAQATGGSVAMPVEKYLAKLAFEEHQKLREDVKLSPDGFTPREAAEAKPDPTAALDALLPSERAAVEPIVTQKAPGEVLPSAGALRDLAVQVVEGKRLGEIQPGRYEEAARRAGDKLAEVATQAAEDATRGARNIAQGTGMAAASDVPGVGDAATRAGAQQTRRAEKAVAATEGLERSRDFSRALAKAADEVRTEAEANRKFLFDYTQQDARAELGKAGGEYQAQMDRLLSGLELGQGVPRAEVARRLATMNWIASEQAEGRAPVVPDSVLAKLDRFVHWKELTPQEMRDFRAAAESIARQAELKNTLIANGKRVEAAVGRAQAVDAAFRNMVEIPVYQRGDVVPKGDAAARAVRAGAAVVIRPEELVRRLDGGDINGPFSTYYWHPLSEAYDRFKQLEVKWTKPVSDAIASLSPETRRRWRTTTFEIAGRQRSMEQAVVVALNQGNASNDFKLLKGYSDVEYLGIKSWTRDTVEEFLSHLNRDDWKFVETIGRSLEAAWPEIAAHEKSITGTEPPKVKARPFTRRLPDGTSIDLQGWYYPVIYDPQFPSGRQAAKDAVLSATYYTASTPQGRLNARIEDYARPIALTLDALPRVVRDFAKDTAMREAVISANSFITHPDVVVALNRTIGEQQTKVLQSAVRDTANDLALPQNGAEVAVHALATLRGGVGSAIFSWNIGQYLQNFSGFAQTLKHVPVTFLRQAVAQMVRDARPAYDFARERSGFMAARPGEVNADVAQAFRTLRDRKALPGPAVKVLEGAEAFSELGMRFWASSDTLVSNITWRGAFEHALAPAEKGGLGLDLESAVRQADRTTRLALGSGRTLDLPAFLRHPVLKLIAPFQSWSSAMFNDYMASSYNARKFVRAGEYGKALREFQGAIVYAGLLGVLSSLLTFRGPKDKEGDKVDAGDVTRWLAVEGLLGPTTWVPYVGPVLRSMEDGRELGVLPYMRSAEVVTRAVKTLTRDEPLELEDYATLGLRGLEAFATVKGLPVTQIRASGGYLLDKNEPKNSAAEVTLGVLAGKAREGKLLKIVEE